MKNSIMKIAHFADAHLGYLQYGLVSRREDFRKAFEQCIRRCIIEKVDAIILCGDTFHHEKPNFVDLVNFRDTLRDLEAEGIEVLAITGNHDQQGYSDMCSWISLFDYVRPIDPDWNYLEDGETCTPIIYHRSGKTIGIFGLDWDRDVQNTVKTRVLPSVAQAGCDFNILAIHAGVGGVLPQDKGMLTDDFLSTISKSSFRSKKEDPLFDYICLGHIHKPYQRYDARCPGSLENCSLEEWEYDDRGFFIVQLFDDGSKDVTKYYPTMRQTKKIRIPVAMNSTQEHINLTALEKLSGIDELALVYIEVFGSVGEQIPDSVLSNLKTFVYNTFRPLYIKIKDVTYVSKKKDSAQVASTPIISQAVTEIFGKNEEVAKDVINLVLNGAEVSTIIDKVEEYVTDNQTNSE